jgi:hypothetical protein
MRYFFIGLLSMALSGCVTETTTTEVMPGADRDEHGCLPSAGFVWCAKTRSCERPWKLAASKGFDNNLAAFNRYCGH